MATLKERLAKQREEIKSRGGNYKYFIVKEGTTRMRLLPAGEENDWAIEAVVYYLGKDIGFVVSPISVGGKCAIAAAHTELTASKTESDRALAKTFRPGKKFFAPAIRFNDEKGKEIDVENGAKLLMMTGGQYNELIELYLDADEAGDFTDPVKGYDIKFNRTGKTKTDTEYTLRKCNPTPLSKKFAKKTYSPEDMLKEIIPTYKETKELIQKFLSLEVEGDDDAPIKKKKKKKRDL